MIAYLVGILRDNPELAIFLTLAAGFAIGRVKIGSFKLGNVVGTLLAGVVIGQLDIDVHPLVKTVFFALFLFATGYKVGPQFFRGLRKDALRQVAVTAVLCLVSLATTVAAARLLRYDCGTAAGLMAGAFTESTVIGTAGDTIEKLNLSGEEIDHLQANIPVAYAVTYLVGTAFVVWFLSSLAPKLFRIDLKKEARELEAKTKLTESAEGDSAYREWAHRAYRVRGTHRTAGDLERAFAPARVFVDRVRHAGTVVDATPDTPLHAGDVVAVTARRHVFVSSANVFDGEVEDRELLDFPISTLDVVVTKREAAGQRLVTLAERQGRGVTLEKLVRGGQEIPFTAETEIDRGDVLRITGPVKDVERAGAALGYVERPTSESDVVFLGLGIVLGGLLGTIAVKVGGIPLSLTASGGALIMGLVFGWLRSVRPTFGRIPEPALWVFDTIGLAVFIGVVGLSAGPTFVAGLKQTGPSLVVVGFLVALIPHASAIAFGRYVLRMNPLILLGACAGAGTQTAALRAIQDEAGSKLPVLGYTVPYAVGNILLTAWGPVIVLLTR
ncbi:MAG TPA: aspartate-alanine antiporter [Candidatus Polarisedimenticolaceae bacterium]|nr:aspartate-alanine antiporter [Candidatus Polarisedimenticolaceae bacterium]